MRMRLISVLVALAGLPVHAELLVSQGTKGTLSVEYTYESSGKTQDINDLHEWRVSRSVKISADMVAQAVLPMPSMHAPDAAQMADLQAKQSHAKNAAQTMAPMMDDIEAIIGKCGEDEACISQAIAKYGMSMDMTPEMEAARKDVGAAASKQDPPRFQMWRATAQKGSYSIDETLHEVIADPICRQLHCTTDQTRKGAGELPAAPTAKKDPAVAAGIAMLEIDSTAQTLFVQLPVSMNSLPYTQTVTTDSPDHQAGTRQAVLSFGTSKPLSVPLKGGGLDQSGETVTKILGAMGDGGTLTIRWHFSAK